VISELFAELREEFDVIVVDSAPLLAVPDTRLLIPLVDNFCLVIRAESTPKGAIRKVIDLMDDDGAEPAGIVINGYEEKSSFLGSYVLAKYGYGGYGGYGQYGGGYGSGSYGSYGSDEEEDG
jgi:Mrp family chromosome partitioning ATPase